MKFARNLSVYARLRDKLVTLMPQDELLIAHTDHNLIRKAAQKAGKHLRVCRTGETAFSERYGREIPVWHVTVL